MKLGWRGALGVTLSAVALWWTLHDVDFSSVMMHVRRADPLLLALSTAAATGIFPLRARRWRPILHSVAPNLSFGPLWRSTAIGMMGSNGVPARARELPRAYAPARGTRRGPLPP